MRGDIVSGAVESSAKLAIKDLCSRYKVGMSPVREALHRLAGEGFVRLRGQRGFTVPPISAEDLDWRAAHPRLAAWFAQVSRRPSVRETAPADDVPRENL